MAEAAKATTPVQTESSKPATGTATVIIGCRLPSGITLEVGLQTLAKNDKGYFTQVKRLDNYQRIVLKGWHHHNTTGLQMPAGVMSERPYLNRGVNAEAWAEWKRTHPDSWLLRNKVLFEAASEAQAQLMATGEAVDGTPTLLLPLDKSQPVVPGITKADFKAE